MHNVYHEIIIQYYICPCRIVINSIAAFNFPRIYSWNSTLNSKSNNLNLFTSNNFCISRKKIFFGTIQTTAIIRYCLPKQQLTFSVLPWQIVAF